MRAILGRGNKCNEKSQHRIHIDFCCYFQAHTHTHIVVMAVASVKLAKEEMGKVEQKAIKTFSISQYLTKVFYANVYTSQSASKQGTKA
jgi:hypothetical protein